jgi:hypothetical protein
MVGRTLCRCMTLVQTNQKFVTPLIFVAEDINEIYCRLKTRGVVVGTSQFSESVHFETQLYSGADVLLPSLSSHITIHHFKKATIVS